MIDQVLYDSAAIVTGLAVATFLVDYSLTRVGARLSVKAADRWSVEGSYELNPTWVEHIDSGRRFSWRILFTAVAVAYVVAGTRLLVGFAELDPAFFAFVAGALLLLQAPVVMLHGQNLLTLSGLADPISAIGALKIRRWFAYRQAAGYCIGFAVLWLVLWLLSQQAFFLGGATGCLFFGLRMWRLGTDARRALEMTPPAVASTIP